MESLRLPRILENGEKKDEDSKSGTWKVEGDDIVLMGKDEDGNILLGQKAVEKLKKRSFNNGAKFN